MDAEDEHAAASPSHAGRRRRPCRPRRRSSAPRNLSRHR
jgi:hypothetical protein